MSDIQSVTPHENDNHIHGRRPAAVQFSGGSPMCHGARLDRMLLGFYIAWFIVIFASTTKSATITVPAGGNPQSAINAAQPGDRIILQANVDYVCESPCVLPVKSGTDFITIES